MKLREIFTCDELDKISVLMLFFPVLGEIIIGVWVYLRKRRIKKEIYSDLFAKYLNSKTPTESKWLNEWRKSINEVKYEKHNYGTTER